MQLQICATVYKKSLDQVRRMVESIPKDASLRIDIDGGWDAIDISHLKEIHDFDLYQHEENQGLAKLRNEQIEECTHEYIQFIDADDYLESYCSNIINNALKTHPYIVATNVTYVNSGKVVAVEKRNLVVGNNRSLSYFVIPSLIIKTEILRKNPDLRFDESGILFEDVMFSMVLTEIVLKSGINNVYRIDIPWYNYDITPSETLSRPKDNTRLIESTLKVIEDLKIKDFTPELAYSRMVEESLRLLQLGDQDLTMKVVDLLKPYKFKGFYK